MTHVKYAPIFSSKCIQNVNQFMGDLQVSDVNTQKDLIEHSVCGSLLNFLDEFEYHSYFVSTKTKYVDSGFADRSTRVEQHGKTVSLCGGKITGALGVAPVVKESVAGAAKARGERDFGEHAAGPPV